jgi:hypothetical protein
MTRPLAIASTLWLAALVAGIAAALAQNATPRLHTNEAEIEEATRPTTLAINDPIAVFAFVLGSLPERVKVYPTENYYYFRFAHNGVPYAGNIRLDASDRDAGKAHFAYYQDLSDWTGDSPVTHLVLDASQGVMVEKVEHLVYRISHQQRSVVFALNDLSQVRPPAGALGPDEKFIGPIFDESAIRFFLVFNSRLKIFHYVLDETRKVADEFLAAKGTDRILIGKRTGFAFYRDHRLDRKILIGVLERNSRLNNYFDGPFDQLPDDFIAGDTLRDAILQADPSLKGQVDRLGAFADGRSRYLIGPYAMYRTEGDLSVFHRCAASKRIPAAVYYKCFVVDDSRGGVRPLALKRTRPSGAAKRPATRGSDATDGHRSQPSAAAVVVRAGSRCATRDQPASARKMARLRFN